MAKGKKSLYERVIPLGIPIAWMQLTSERKRFAVALAGITFAVTMMLFQMGLQRALYRQVVGPLVMLDADVVLVSPNYEYFGVGRGFPAVRLSQAYSLNEVVSAYGIKLGCMSFKNVEDGRERDIFAIAFDPSKDVFLAPEIKRNQGLLKRRGDILFDAQSRDQYGRVEEIFNERGGKFLRTELSGVKCDIVGLVEIGATFAADGNVLMSLDTYSLIWPNMPMGVYDVGVIKLKEGSDVESAVGRLNEMFPDDVRVMSKTDFIEAEKDYWAVRTPIGFVIGASMAVAIFVGAVIVYQILYTDVSEHIPEYATLKAIGFDDTFFISIILQESLILSFLGFIPGVGLSAILYKMTRDIANMPTYMSGADMLIVFGLSLAMCMAAGLLATRKLRRANPADIF